MRVSIRTSGLHAQGWWSLREADALFSTVTLEGDLAVGTIVPFAALCDAIADDVGGDDGEASAVVEQTDASAMTALSLRPGLVRDEAECARLLGLDDVESQTRLRRLVEHGLVDATPEGVALGEASSSIWPSFLPASMDVVAYPCDLTVPGSRGVPVGIRFVGPREHRFHASRQGCPPGHVGLFRAPKAVTRVLAASIAGQPTDELITHLVGLDSTS